jgi:hypothetical protein
MPDPRDVSVSKLLYKIVCEMVDQSQFVVIKTHVTEDGAGFAIDVHKGRHRQDHWQTRAQCSVTPHHRECDGVKAASAICCRSR